MQVRKIKPTDNLAVAELIKAVMTSYGCVGEGYSINDAELDDMYNAYNNELSIYYVITDDDDKIVGGAGIAPLLGGEAHICELKKMYFYASARGLGLGTKLLTLLLDDARARGYTECYLETVERMTAASKLYSKFGFKKLCKQQGGTGHSSCDTYYSRSLMD